MLFVLLLLLHAMAKLPCRYYGRDRPRLTIKGSIFVPMFRDGQRSMLNRQVNRCKWIGRIVLFSLLSTFSPFLRRPVQISLPIFVCAFFLSSVLKLWAIAGT